MSRRRRGRRLSGFRRELDNEFLLMRGAEKRKFFNDISDRIVVAAGVAMAVAGYGAGGLLGAIVGLAVGLYGGASALVKGGFRRG